MYFGSGLSSSFDEARVSSYILRASRCAPARALPWSGCAAWIAKCMTCRRFCGSRRRSRRPARPKFAAAKALKPMSSADCPAARAAVAECTVTLSWRMAGHNPAPPRHGAAVVLQLEQIVRRRCQGCCAVAGLIQTALSQVILVFGFGHSCSQALFEKAPSQIVGSGRNVDFDALGPLAVRAAPELSPSPCRRCRRGRVRDDAVVERGLPERLQNRPRFGCACQYCLTIVVRRSTPAAASTAPALRGSSCRRTAARSAAARCVTVPS